MTFKRPEEFRTVQQDSQPKSGLESGVESEIALQILSFLKANLMSKAELARKLGKDKPSRYLNELMAQLLKRGFVEYTIPDKPNSRLQKYRLTKTGAQLIKKQNK